MWTNERKLTEKDITPILIELDKLKQDFRDLDKLKQDFRDLEVTLVKDFKKLDEKYMSSSETMNLKRIEALEEWKSRIHTLLIETEKTSSGKPKLTFWGKSLKKKFN